MMVNGTLLSDIPVDSLFVDGANAGPSGPRRGGSTHGKMQNAGKSKMSFRLLRPRAYAVAAWTQAPWRQTDRSNCMRRAGGSCRPCSRQALRQAVIGNGAKLRSAMRRL